MRCTNCGTELNEGFAFCYKCGAKVIKQASSPDTSDYDWFTNNSSTRSKKNRFRFIGGTGTEANPYTIGSKDALAEFRDAVNKGNEFDGEYIKLTDNIDLGGIGSNGAGRAGYEWKPIGDRAKDIFFRGTFCGCGHIIKGLYINQPQTDNDYGSTNGQGLFGQNLGTINDVAISGIVSGNEYVAGIAAYNAGTILNCTNFCKIVGTYCIGGIAGFNSGKIKGCLNSGYIKGGHYVGGIAGHSKNGNISECCNMETIESNIYYGSGGIAGIADESTISESLNSGHVSGIMDVGGVAGWICLSTVKNCMNTGKIYGQKQNGGIIGRISSGGTVTSCYSLKGTCKTLVALNEGGDLFDVEPRTAVEIIKKQT